MICGSSVVAIGLFVIFGWYGHWSTLDRIFPSAVEMKFNTAVGFILCGPALIMLWLRQERITLFLGSIAFLFMALSLTENLSGRDLHIDAALFRSYQHDDAFPNRPSPLTAASFVLSAAALILAGMPFNLRFRSAIAGIIACGVWVISFVAMFGYTFGIESASGWGPYARMSTYTAATFIVLCTGLFIWAWAMAKQSNLNFIRMLPIAGALTLMAMIALGSAVSFVQLHNSSGWRLHTYKVLDSSRVLLSDIVDTQRGMRSFILTGQPATLAIFRNGSTKVPRDLANLISLTGDNARQQRNLNILSQDLRELKDYSNQLFLARRHSLQEAIKMESVGTGFAIYDRTLVDLQSVNDEEQSLLALRTAKVDSDFHNTSRLLTYGSILAAALLILANVLASYEVGRRRRTENQLMVAMTQQKELTQKAQAAERAKSEFLSNMSHELRTPLNAILGFAQLMESAEPAPSAYQTKCLRQVLQGGWYLLDLINEILDLSAIESGKLPLSKESVSLSELLSTCRNMMEAEAQQRKIQMVFPSFDQPIYVRADHTRLKQILINLLSNALKYNREHGTVTVSCVEHASEKVRILVKDTGEGLPPEKVAQLFTPFNRLGRESSDIVGTGIGLVMSKRLAELMDGIMGAESVVGEGSVFWCELPLAPAPEPALLYSGQPEAPSGGNFAHDAGKRTLLYVEDNPANMVLIEDLITRFPDMKLLTAVDATLGIELARTARPDVILMDLHLPGISGLEALRILRDDPCTAKIPVIALSANATPRDIAKGIKAGFSSYITKPIKIKDFSDALTKSLESMDKEMREPAENHHDQLVGHP